MNKFLGIGRLTEDPAIRRTPEGLAIARWSLAIDRRGEGTDFPSCNAFGKTAEFAEKYLHKGMKIGITGRVQTGSYTNKDGNKVYTTDIIVEEVDFCERKADGTMGTVKSEGDDSFMNIPEGIEEELPFH